jgi:hypothetical protein
MSSDLGTPDHPDRRLWMVPIVVVTDPGSVALVVAGIRRAGGAPRVADTDDGGIDGLTLAVSDGAEVLIVETEPTSVARVLRDLGPVRARGLPVLSLTETDGLPRLGVDSVHLLSRDDLADLNVPVPAIDDEDLRRGLWNDLRAAKIEERHHLVEVDGRPALRQLEAEGRGRDEDWVALAAGAAGVLAGRLAATNRRWRAQLDT